MKRWACAAVLVAAALLSYAGSFDAPFVFDDRAAVVDNPTIRRLWPLSEPLTPPDDGRAVAGRPLVNLSFALNFAWSRVQPWSYRLVNVVLHALAGLALFGIVRRVLELPRWRERNVNPTLMAFATALLWLLHPLQTESVTCVAQRTEVLGGLFYLATLYAFIRGVSAASAPGGATGWLVLSGVACAGGMLSKETVATAPLIVLLLDRTWFAGSLRGALQLRGRYYAGLALTWLPLALLVARGGGTRGSAAGFGSGMSSWVYLLRQAEALVLYLRLSIWPHPLVVDYGTVVPGSLREVWLEVAVGVALLIATAWALVRKPVLGFLGAWFFVILAPSSSIVPLAAQTVAEHRMYLPLAAIIAGLVAVIGAVAGARFRTMLFLLLAIAAGFGTWTRNQVYRDEVRLWRDTVTHAPDNPRAWANLGAAWLDASEPGKAASALQRAAELQPRSPEIRANLSLTWRKLGRLSDAITAGEEAVRLDATSANAQVNLAAALEAAEQWGPAARYYRSALQLQPEATDVRQALARMRLREAQVLRRAGDTAAARGAAAEARELTPADAEIQFFWGNLCAADRDLEAAITAYRLALKATPDHVRARNNLANALLMTGRYDESIAEYREVLRAHPTDSAVRENLEQALALKARAVAAPASSTR